MDPYLSIFFLLRQIERDRVRPAGDNVCPKRRRVGRLVFAWAGRGGRRRDHHNVLPCISAVIEPASRQRESSLGVGGSDGSRPARRQKRHFSGRHGNASLRDGTGDGAHLRPPTPRGVQDGHRNDQGRRDGVPLRTVQAPNRETHCFPRHPACQARCVPWSLRRTTRFEPNHRRKPCRKRWRAGCRIGWEPR